MRFHDVENVKAGQGRAKSKSSIFQMGIAPAIEHKIPISLLRSRRNPLVSPRLWKAFHPGPHVDALAPCLWCNIFPPALCAHN